MADPPPLYTDPLRAVLERAVGQQYEIVRLLGRGGMGAVYLGVERFLERQVAIKILPAEAAREPEMRERFRREARTAAQLSHPNIVPLHSYGEAEGMPYFVMGFVRGEGLTARLARQGRLDPEEVRRILTDVADALDYAHRRGVVHRDIKPDNILLEEETGRVLLADFGVARQAATASTLTVDGTIVGTPYYMSPEQATADKSLDGRSDLYSLGVVGYELLAGRRPFEGESIQGILTQHLLNAPPPLLAIVPDAPPLLVQALDRCLAKNAADRWADGRTLKAALVWREEGLESQMPPGAERLPSILLASIAMFLGLTIPVQVAFLTGASTLGRIPIWSQITFVVGSLLLPALLVLHPALPARRAGWGWGKILGIAGLEPGFWITWWPRASRRPGNIWERLPRSVRVARCLQGLILIGVLVLLVGSFVVMKVNSADTIPVMGVLSILGLALLILGLLLVFFPLVGALVAVHWFGRRAGIRPEEVLKLLNASNTSTFWHRPDIARILLPPAVRAEGSEPRTSAEFVARIEEIAGTLRGHPLAEEAVAGARRLARALTAVDRELGEIEKDLDPAQLAQVERQLAALSDGGDSDPRRQMRELLEGQRQLLRRLAGQREHAGRRKDQLAALLRTLWLQLAALRAGTARQRLDDAAVSGKVRDVVQEIAAHVSATEEVQAAMVTIQTPHP